MRLLATLLVTALVQAASFAQQTVATSGPVSTGKILALDPARGVLIMHSDQTNGPITFVGVEKASLQTIKGRQVTIKDLQAQQAVTVYYAVAGDRWVASRMVIAETANPAPPVEEPPVALTAAERQALQSKAANDGDITTTPGVKARIDNDITTQPGKTDPATNTDITKRPDAR